MRDRLMQAVAILLLIPPVRGLIMKLVARRFANRRVVVRSTTIDGEWEDVTPPQRDGNGSANTPSRWTQN